jgi:hypothetical protein
MIGKDETRRQNKIRRSVFAVWIALTLVVAVYVGLAGPLMPVLGHDIWLVGVVVPPFMIVLAAISIGWLAWLCFGGGRRSPDHYLPTQ